MFSVGKILGELSSSMAILDGGDEVGIGLDFAGQFVTHDFDQSIRRKSGIEVRKREGNQRSNAIPVFELRFEFELATPQ